MLAAVSKNKVSYLLLGIFALILFWWLRLRFLNITEGNEPYLFNWSYGLVPLIGALYGVFVVAKVWGGYRSIIGKGIVFISLGLLGQWFGLQIWTYYNVILKIEIPYPSLADIGYFALIPFYTLGSLMFAHAAGAKFSLRSISGKILALLIPLTMLVIAYFFFVRNVGFDSSNIIRTFFDFAYPLGEVIPVSIAIFTLFASKKYLGGKMRGRILYLIFAFSFQFITEYAFLYAVGNETYYNGGINDLLYAISYTIMSIGLISFKKYE